MLLNPKLRGQVFLKKKLINNYSVPLMNELSTLARESDEYNSLACSGDAIITLLTKHANPLE